MQYASKEMLRGFAELQWLGRCMCRRRTRGVDKAHMNVHTVADEFRVGLWREDHALAQPVRCGARHLAGDYRVVGSDQCRLRHDGYLELARTVFGEKRVRNDPGGAQCSREGLAKAILAAEGAEGVGVTGLVGQAGVEEFLLEGRNEPQAGRLVQRLDRAAQKVPWAAFPWASVGIADVAQEEMLDRRAIGEIDPHLGSGVR